jgi:hypothetical protein
VIRLPIPGALYADASPDGAWAALMPGSRIQTSRGSVPLPPSGDLLFLRMVVFRGVLYLCGQGHNDGQCWLWNGSWQAIAPTFGVSPCAFGVDRLCVAISGSAYREVRLDTGEVRDVPCALGSQGIRYVTSFGQVVTGDDTYRDGHYFEYTRLGDVQVGQGDAGGCLINGRVLEPGDCRFIRESRADEQLAVAIAKLPERQCVIYWLTVGEIAQLPLPAQEPDKEPDKEPEKPMPTVPDESAFARAFLAPRLKRFASLDETRAHTFAAVNALCTALRAKGDLNWGVLEKTGGDRVRERAADILLYAFGDGTAQVVDVVNDAEGHDGAPSPSWSLKDIRPISQWRQPYADEPPIDPPDEDEDEPPVDLSPILKSIVDLRADVAALRVRLAACEMENEEQNGDIDRLMLRVIALEQKPAPIYKATGSTSREWGHSHRINVTLEPQ